MKLFKLSAIGVAAALALASCSTVSNTPTGFDAEYSAAHAYLVKLGVPAKYATPTLIEYRDGHELHKAMWASSDGKSIFSDYSTAKEVNAITQKNCEAKSPTKCYPIMLDDKFAGK